jgi:hypothetical protein
VKHDRVFVDYTMNRREWEAISQLYPATFLEELNNGTEIEELDWNFILEPLEPNP